VSVSRRGVLLVMGASVGVAALGVAGWQVAPDGTRFRIKQSFGLNPDPFVPDAPEGQVRLEEVTSTHMGEIELFTAVPEGYGDGRGLPVLVVLHGASASAAELQGFGLGRFVTAAVQAGAPPFVLAGTDDGPLGWLPDGDTDPQAMLREELPQWLGERGFDADRRALWGWSRGGYGALRYVQAEPTWAQAVALFSPALHAGDPSLADLGVFEEVPLGLWCGEDDPFRDGADALSAGSPVPPDPDVAGPGGHTRVYWNDQTLQMLAWITAFL
jgi:predicted esterase